MRRGIQVKREDGNLEIKDEKDYTLVNDKSSEMNSLKKSNVWKKIKPDGGRKCQCRGYEYELYYFLYNIGDEKTEYYKVIKYKKYMGNTVIKEMYYKRQVK
jgi:hypothetical protein